jgi:hypothetical protein
MKKITITFEVKSGRKKARPQNQANWKRLLGAFVCLLEVVLVSGVWHIDQAAHMQLIIIAVLIAIFICMLVIFSNRP